MLYTIQAQRFEKLRHFVEAVQPEYIKLIDPDLGTCKMIRQVSPLTRVLVRHYTGMPEFDDVAQHPDAYVYGREYARDAGIVLADIWDYFELLEGENEMVVYNGASMQRASDFLRGFADACAILGKKPVGPNFSEGHPQVYVDGGYQKDDSLMKLLVPGLRALKAAGGMYGRHEYDGGGDLLRGWSGIANRGYRIGRYLGDFACWPDDLQDMPVVITEGVRDWFCDPWHESGGWAHRGGTVEQFKAELVRVQDWVYAKDKRVKAVFLFGFGMYHPQWDEYDFAETDESIEGVIEACKRGASSVPPVVPPVIPPVEADMQVADFLQAMGNVTALQKKACVEGMGGPVSGEISFSSDGKTYVTRVFAGANKKGGALVAEMGHWAMNEIMVLDPTTGLPLVQDAPVALPDGKLPYSFPAVLTAAGAVGEEVQPIAGQPFYRLFGASVVIGVSAFVIVTVYGKNKLPKAGLRVARLFPDGNGEIVLTDGSGVARFQNAASSAFTNPGTGPFTVFIPDQNAFKDGDSVPKRLVWTLILSDKVKSLGDFQGQHAEESVQYIEQ